MLSQNFSNQRSGIPKLFLLLLPHQRPISISTTSFAVLSKTEFCLNSSAFLLENHRTGLLLGQKAKGRSLRDGSRASNQKVQTTSEKSRLSRLEAGAAALIEVRTHADGDETLTTLGQYTLACKHRTNHRRTTPETLIPSEQRSEDLFGTVALLFPWLLESRTFFGRSCVERALKDENATSVHLP